MAFAAFSAGTNCKIVLGRLSTNGVIVVVDEAGYAEDISADTAWAELARSANAILVDVRTIPEWNFVGIPDLSSLNKTVALIEWQSYPAMTVNANFLAMLDEAVTARGLGKDAPVYFICRSGARSKAAATAAIAGGYTTSFNVAGGFEGPLDADRHRGTCGGWKAAGLPWIQS